MGKFDGKVVIVTGASSGIGATTAIGFAKEGAKLTICGRNKERLNETVKLCRDNGAEVLEYVGDLLEYENLEPLINKTVEKFSAIDILINNAGHVTFQSIEEAELDVFENLYKIHARAPVFLSKFALPYLKRSKGCIVNVSSLLAVRYILASKCISYAMFKAAMDHFTKGFSAECAPSGVRVNSINPGFVQTTKVVDVAKADAKFVNEMIEVLTTLHKLGFVSQESVVDGIMFLCLSPHITGTTLKVDSGAHCA